MQSHPLSFTSARETSSQTAPPLPSATGTDLSEALLASGQSAVALPKTQFLDSIAPAVEHMHLLIVDDDAAVREACSEIAASLGFFVRLADSVATARDIIAAGPIDLVLLDVKMPRTSGLTLLEELRLQRPEAIVIVMTAFATVSSAVEAMRIGASDYITKPFSIEELSTVIERAAQRRVFDNESRTLRERLRSGQGPGNLLGNSPPMEKLYRILSKVAVTTHPVLICGEAGTGKELVARSIHANGPSANLPFVPVDCGSLLPELVEGELFGYAKGGVPGALRSKTGLLAAPDGGTVFLDEIGELTLDLQARLLRALQEKQVRPVGGGPPLPIRARILAATNRDIEAMVNNGSFRKDLYFRLNVVSLRIPPLRERKSDIPMLAAYILDRTRRDSGLAYTFSDDSLHMLMAYDWPGNVRELEHAIERACALSSGPVLHRADFPSPIQNSLLDVASTLAQPSFPDAPDLHRADHDKLLSIAELEKQAILNTVRQVKGDKLLAARLLGIGKTTLYRKLKEYGLGEGQGLN
jgi:two-component system response regulator HydG